MIQHINRYMDAALHRAARTRKKVRKTLGMRRNSANYRWGILGCGSIASSFARGLVYLPDAELTAAASCRSGISNEFVTKHDGRKAYSRYEELLTDQEIDIVYVATPHNFHYEHIRLCLEAGKHVLCEKPLTINTAQAADLMALAGEKKLFLMEAMWTRFLPATQVALKWIREGLIGEVRMVTSSFGFHADVGPSHRLLNRSLAGGALLDIGVYPLSFANMIFRADPIRSTSNAHIGITGVDTRCEGEFEYANGATATWSASLESELPGEAIIQGTKGRIRLPAFWQAREVSLTVEGKSCVNRRFAYPSTGLQFEAREVMDCLNLGRKESPLMPLSDTMSVLRQMDQMRATWGLNYPGEG